MRLVLFPLVGICAAVASLLYVDFRMLDHSEEAGIASWGIPFPMVETGPFYAGYLGIPARQGGARYIRNAMGALQNPMVHSLGVFLNIAFYFTLPLAVMKLAKRRRQVFGVLVACLKESGLLGGLASLLGIGTLLIALIIVTYGFLRWLSYLL